MRKSTLTSAGVRACGHRPILAGHVVPGARFRSMSDTATRDAIQRLQVALARVARHHGKRGQNSVLARSLDLVAIWQARRLRRSYADLEAQPRYAGAIRFFETDLYGATDFTQRDADLARIAPLLERLLPAGVIATVATAVELNALSQDLDRGLANALGSQDSALTVPSYCAAYRRAGCYDQRVQQIRLIGDVGVALDRYVGMRVLRTALALMRKPARAAGLAALQNFLERGFDAFGKMHGAIEFLATIESRESAIHDAIVAGSDAPFPDPLA